MQHLAFELRDSTVAFAGEHGAHHGEVETESPVVGGVDVADRLDDHEVGETVGDLGAGASAHQVEGPTVDVGGGREVAERVGSPVRVAGDRDEEPGVVGVEDP